MFGGTKSIGVQVITLQAFVAKKVILFGVNFPWPQVLKFIYGIAFTNVALRVSF